MPRPRRCCRGERGRVCVGGRVRGPIVLRAIKTSAWPQREMLNCLSFLSADGGERVEQFVLFRFGDGAEVEHDAVVEYACDDGGRCVT